RMTEEFPKATFEEHKISDYITALKQGYKPKPIEEVLPQRLRESVMAEHRNSLLNEAKQFGQIAEKGTKLPEGFNIIKDIPELKGWAFPEEFHNTLKTTYDTFFGDEATKNVLKAYDKLQTIWKRWALATPGYHIRNFQSDTFSGLMEYGLDFVNPGYWEKAEKLLSGKNIEFLSDTGKLVKVDKQIFTRAGITSGTQYATEGLISKEQKILNYISPAQWSMKAGNVRENLGRAVAGIIELKKGSNLVNAAFNVKKVFFDYSNTTPFFSNVVKRFVPFATWLFKNLERQFELLGKRTGAYATIPKALNYLSNVADTVLGGTEEYEKVKPEFYNDLGVTRTAITDYSGNALAFNPNLPFQDWSRLSWKDLLSATSPMVKIPWEIATNRDVFFGTDINTKNRNFFGEKVGYQEAPKYLQWLKFLPEGTPGFKKDEDGKLYISDRTAYAIRQIPILYSLSRMMPATEQVKTPTQMLSILGGIKFFPVEMEKMKEQKYKDVVSMLNSEIDEAKTLKIEVPDVNQITQALKNYYKEIAANQTNYGQVKELKNTMDVIGGTKEERLLIKLLSQPYEEKVEKIKDMNLAELLTFFEKEGIIVDKNYINEFVKENYGNQ
ncbi:MAG: hypothetical protein M1308_23670, partial [Actinobacteria bacterium]|nr:hypothetical protein [Actinomycetota bacterium]